MVAGFGFPVAEEHAPSVDPIRRSIRETVERLGPRLKSAGPKVIVASLAAGAFLPVVGPLLAVPFVGAGAASAAAGGLMALVGGAGQSFLASFVEQHARRGRDGARRKPPSEDEIREALERELLARLEAEDTEAVALRLDVSRLLQAVGGVEAALAAASDDVKVALADGLRQLSTELHEFRWMLDDAHRALAEIRAGQKHQDGLLREALAKINILLLERVDGDVGVAPAALPDIDERAPPAAVPSPYKGLEAFQPNDASYFFGREALVADISARLAEAPFLGVVGASGSGKSSVVRAGVVPALWRGALPGSGGWKVLIFTPGEHPLEEVAMRIARLQGIAPGSILADLQTDPARARLAIDQALIDEPAQARVVLVVDQFEEVFTLCRQEEERRLFIDALIASTATSDSQAVVILAVRADFYPRCAAYPSLVSAVQDRQVLVGPMDETELRAAIEGPAARAGLSLEPGLVEAILRDVGDEPGALPLVSHALFETWARRRGRMLTRSGYADSGGVKAAIARTAETVLSELAPAQQTIARNIFLRLTELGEGTEDTRRRVNRDELVLRADDAAELDTVLQVLAARRLVTVGEETVEVAHEALIREWPTLRRWLDEDREGLVIHRRLTDDAREWLELARDPSALYRGARLQAAVDWAGEHTADLNSLERQFLEASRAAEETELDATRRRNRRLRILALGLAVVALAALAATAFAVVAREQANDQRKTAESRTLATEALANLDTRVDLALLLSLEAYRKKPTFEARNAALAAFKRTSRLLALLSGRDANAVAFHPTNGTLAVAGLGGVDLWDVRKRQRIGQILDDVAAQAVSYSPSGTMLAVQGQAELILWDVRQKQVIKARQRPKGGLSDGIDFSRNGTMIASVEGNGNQIARWQVPSLRPIGKPLPGPNDPFGLSSIRFSPTDDVLAAASSEKLVLWDHLTRGQPRSQTLGRGGAETIAFSPDGLTLAAADLYEIVLWDVQARKRQPLRFSAPDLINALAFNGDGSILASAGEDVRLWDIRGGSEFGDPLVAHTGDVVDVAFGPDDKLASASNDQVVLWDGGRDNLGVLLKDVAPEDVAFSPRRAQLAFVTTTELGLFDVDTRSVSVVNLGGDAAEISHIAYSRDGGAVAAANGNRVLMWRVHPTPQQGARRLPGRLESVSDIAFSPAEETLAAAALNGVTLWSGESRWRRPVRLTGTQASAIAFSRDGNSLAIAAPDAIYVWDTRVHRPTEQLRFIPDVEAFAFSPDGKLLALAAEKDVYLWDRGRSRPIGAPLGAHRDTVAKLAFSPDGRTLASASLEELVFWDVGTRRVLGEPFRGLGAVVAFDRDGLRLATTDFSDTILLRSVFWTEDIRSFRPRFCEVVRRNLNVVEWREYLPGEPYRKTCPKR